MQSKIVTVEHDDTNTITTPGLSSGLRSFRCFLRKEYYLRGKAHGKYAMKEDHLGWLSKDLNVLKKNLQLPENQRLTELYLYETNIYHHYSRLEKSVYGPYDPLFVEPKASHKAIAFLLQ